MVKSPPKSPGDMLDELLRERGMNQTEAATKLGLTRPYLNGVINGKYPLGPDLRLRLQPLLEIKPEFWEQAQRDYEAWQSSADGRAARMAATIEEFNNALDLRGAHTLVDHEVEGALKAGALEISPFDLMRDRERLLATSLELTLGLRGYLHAPGTAETTSVVTKPALLLKRSQMITLSTRESLVLSSRLRAHVNGLTQQWADKFLHCFHQRVLEPGFRGALTFALINAGPSDVELPEGEPCLSLSFEYLAQEPLAQL
jgi:addiction module HigA family antidote